MKLKLTSTLFLSVCILFSLSASNSGIEVYEANPRYWQYDGKPMMLIGASSDDNLFQTEDFEDELMFLHTLGGNYVRCTMSSRDEDNVKPYLKNEDGLYDLEQFNPEFWDRFERLLTRAEELDVVVQIEIWATMDFYWEYWDENPFNPELNVNYDEASSGISALSNYPPQTRANPFFLSIPELENHPAMIPYQKAFVDKLLGISLKHSNVLYLMDNETSVDYRWGRYWSKYVRESADKAGKKVYLSEMWDVWDPSNGEVPGAKIQGTVLGGWFETHYNDEIPKHSGVRFTLNDAESYQFVDLGNNNTQIGETHYQTSLWVWKAMLDSPEIRPITNGKIYGGYRENLWAGTINDGVERFWRNLFAGHASVRFHRQPTGVGFSKIPQEEVQRMRQVVNSVDLFNMEPCNEILSSREDNEAFCLASRDRGEMLVYFTRQGQVEIDVTEGTYEVTTFVGDKILKEVYFTEKGPLPAAVYRGGETLAKHQTVQLPQVIHNIYNQPAVMRFLRIESE